MPYELEYVIGRRFKQMVHSIRFRFLLQVLGPDGYTWVSGKCEWPRNPGCEGVVLCGISTRVVESAFLNFHGVNSGFPVFFMSHVRAWNRWDLERKTWSVICRKKEPVSVWETIPYQACRGPINAVQVQHISSPLSCWN